MGQMRHQLHRSVIYFHLRYLAAEPHRGSAPEVRPFVIYYILINPLMPNDLFYFFFGQVHM